MDEGREYLKKLRENSGKTQHDIADIWNIGQPTYSMYETGRIKNIDMDFLRLTAEYYDIPMDFLLAEEIKFRYK